MNPICLLSYPLFLLMPWAALAAPASCNGEMADVFLRGYTEGMESLKESRSKFQGSSKLWLGQYRSRLTELGGQEPVENAIGTQTPPSPPQESIAFSCRKAGYQLAEAAFLREHWMKGGPACQSGIDPKALGYFVGLTTCGLQGPLTRLPKSWETVGSAPSCGAPFAQACTEALRGALTACSPNDPSSELTSGLSTVFCGAPLTP